MGQIRIWYGIDVLHLRGEVAEVVLGFGNIKSANPIKFMLIDSAQNFDGSWTKTDEIPAINANNFKGSSAIMGIGLRNDSLSKGIANPFALMGGTGKYLIHLPEYGENTGYVILNPNNKDIAGFQDIYLKTGKFPLANGWNIFLDDSLPGKVEINGKPFPGGTLLDTGTPLTWTDSPQFPAVHIVKGKDTVVTMEVGKPVVSSTTSPLIRNTVGKTGWRQTGHCPHIILLGYSSFLTMMCYTMQKLAL
ncbi:hypothetical protein [Mucilaginibacter psychrotolerans]|uniref:Uncharacterized protein n=1 Tax=Mucilaginibacter psychrotolerans TaxID=1524096 RepID=A0A4Y8RX56_9SPHI|nr:hypothetical protein [Mucilaginibacter psychrotolerans]TFF29725.1 hypothetical protein E2R66_28040 [Mucilaginibacter psychrotolerans]